MKFLMSLKRFGILRPIHGESFSGLLNGTASAKELVETQGTIRTRVEKALKELDGVRFARNLYREYACTLRTRQAN